MGYERSAGDIYHTTVTNKMELRVTETAVQGMTRFVTVLAGLIEFWLFTRDLCASPHQDSVIQAMGRVILWYLNKSFPGCEGNAERPRH